MISENSTFAVVTGASTGIGKAIAHELAVRKHNLILHSLPGEGLCEYCRELEELNGVKVLYIEGDLTSEAGPGDLAGFVKSGTLRVDILINNAGIGYEGPIESYPEGQIDRMIQLNIRALTILTSLLTPELKSHKRSYIVNISSFGIYVPSAYKSVYLASKAYIYYFTRALQSELTGTGIHTCVAVPASVKTNKTVIDRTGRYGWFARNLELKPEEVAYEVIRGMFRKSRVILPGRLSRAVFRFCLFIPEGIMILVTRRIFSNYRIEK